MYGLIFYFYFSEFLDSTNNTLKRYGGNIEELFLNKTIEIYLDSARTIMKKNLGEMIEIEPKVFCF